MSRTYDDLRVPDRGKSDDINSLDLFSFAQRKNQTPPPEPPPPPPPPREREPLPEPAAVVEPPPSMDEPPQNIPETPVVWNDPSSSHIRPGRNLNPDGPSPLGGLRTAALTTKRGPADYLIPIVAVVGVAVTLALVFGVVKGFLAGRAGKTVVAPTVAERIVDEEPAAAPKPVAAKAVRKPATAAPATPAVPAVPARPLLVKIDVPGVRCSMDGAEQVILFDAGIFASAEKLSPAGEVLLSRVGRQIIASKKKFNITVIGCTDNGTVKPNSRFKTNEDLGLLRAASAIKVLQTAGLPAASLRAVSYGEKWSPYPNDISANRARNRTVVLRLTSS